MSKYFSNAKENKNNEKTEINKDGISVNSEKNTMYFLFATDPLKLILFFIEFAISLNIIIKKTSNSAIFKKSK